ncbi:MAG: hypothetical protein H6741_33570 [Alphaproteobacteria bacterium]|nr:hypothetical protein [Alphaproteobacteria bacterium]
MDDPLLDDDPLPQPLMTGPIWMAAAALALSFMVSFTNQRTVNGEVVEFKDWGAAGGGALALLLALPALKEALGPLAGDKKLPRLAILGLIGLGALYRLAYGLGLLT